MSIYLLSCKTKNCPRSIHMHATSRDLNPHMYCKGHFFGNSSDCKVKVVIQRLERLRDSSRERKKFEYNARIFLKFTYCDILWSLFILKTNQEIDEMKTRHMLTCVSVTVIFFPMLKYF